jgi:group II intron reverse transcriptase/maturase
MSKVMHQMSAKAERAGVARGEALRDPASDETQGTTHETEGTGSGLLLEALTRQNLLKAMKRVKANKGAAGIDGMDIDQTVEYLKHHWSRIRSELLAGTYRPSPVRRVVIPKPDGGERELGIPTVVDRLIQQALLQVLQPLIDPTFSEHSHGFRPARRAHDAVLAAQSFVQSGKKVVVDVDLEKFFDRVNHDILIDRLSKRIHDAGVIRLVRAYLSGGIMVNGVVLEREEGTPQGGPLSPLLANIMLDEVDKELERRGYSFARYADDCNVYVGSRKSGERVMALLKRLYAKLHLRVNESKSAVASAYDRKFLGYSFWAAKGKAVKLRVADKAQKAYKQRVRQLTRRIGGKGMVEVALKLKQYVNGWKAYFKLADTPRVWRELDEWMRHRLRAMQLKQWKQGRTMYRELTKLGAPQGVAERVAANSRCWWRNSDGLIKTVLTIQYFDKLGAPRLV